MAPHAILFGFINPVLGRYEKAVEEAHKAIEPAPDTYWIPSAVPHSRLEVLRLRSNAN